MMIMLSSILVFMFASIACAQHGGGHGAPPSHPAPMPRQAPVHIPAPQAPIHVAPPQAPTSSPAPQVRIHAPSQPPSPIVPKSHHLKLNIETPLLPRGPSLELRYSPFSRTWTSHLGIFPSIRTQTGKVTRTVGRTSSAPQKFFSRQGRGDFRHRDFFRHRFNRNLLLFSNFLPFLIVPYYSDYTETYYMYYSDFYYPDYTVFYYPEYIEPYPQVVIENPASEIALEMSEIDAFLQSVLQAMKIFDIPEFYNRPENQKISFSD